MALGGFVLGSPILYLKAMRILMFQLSGFYCMYSYLTFTKAAGFRLHVK